MSADGFMAGPEQSLEEPVGLNGKLVHEWVFPTQSFRQWFGGTGGTTGIDNDYVARGFTNIGATIMGRNMFGPIRGPWLDDEWKGWWGPSPAFQHPVFVLTHHSRESLDMGNGTTFHFVTGGIQEACSRAFDAAGGKEVRVGGGANTLHQFLEASILDELHVAQTKAVLGTGELLFSNPDLQLRNYTALKPVASENVVHQTYVKK